MRRRVLVGCLAGLLLALAAMTAPVVEAQDEEQRLEDVERQIQDFRSRIEAARSERTAYAEAIEVAQARLGQLAATLSEAEAALMAAESVVRAGEDAVAELDRRIRLLDAELGGTRLEQRLTRDMIRDRAVELYMNASSGVYTAFFGTEDVEAASIKLEYTRGLLEDTEILLASLQVLERQEITRQDRLWEEQDREAVVLQQLEAELVRAEERRTAVEAAREDVRREVSLQESLLAEVTAEIAQHEDHVVALEAESKQLELEILRRQVREGRAPGRLAWPVGGEITSPFGWRIHPILGGRRMHNGIDMGSWSGEPIHAAGNGTVILAERWGGYGRTVVIDHGGRVATLYGHQSSIAVSVGDEVLAGDVIGYVGCSGYCTGPHLHFEVREVGAPVDPMLYLPR